MTMVKALFIPTLEAVEHSFVLSSTAIKDVNNYCSNNFASRIRHVQLHKELARLDKINLEVHSQLKVAVREVERLNKELKSVNSSKKLGAETPNTKKTAPTAHVTPKPDRCLSVTPKPTRENKELDVFWDSDDSDTEVPLCSRTKYTRKRPLEERHHYFKYVGNGWWEKVVPYHTIRKTSNKSSANDVGDQKFRMPIKMEEDQENYCI